MVAAGSPSLQLPALYFNSAERMKSEAWLNHIFNYFGRIQCRAQISQPYRLMRPSSCHDQYRHALLTQQAEAYQHSTHAAV
jgi:hypothetical protein